jgi:hypothetical protein
MTNKRFNKFNKEFSYFKTNPYFNQIRQLYIENVIKNITSAERYLTKIKITKKGQVYKTSSKLVNEIESKYKSFVSSKLEANKLNTRLLTINRKKIQKNNYGVRVHQREFLRVQRKNPDKLYIQTIRYYGKFTNKNEYEFVDATNFKTTTFQTIYSMLSKKGKEFYDTLKFKMTLESGAYWLIWLWCYDNDKNYATIETTAYKKVNLLKTIDYNQLYQRNNSNTCVYDGFLSFFNVENNINKKKMYNRLVKNTEYAKPYTDSTLKEICDLTNTKLIIKDLITGNDKIINTPNAKFTIEFLNTRYNHLDLLTHSYDDIIEVDLETYDRLKKEVEFYIEKFGKLITLNNIYKIKDDDFKIKYKEWKQSINYNDLLCNIQNKEFDLINQYDNSTHTFFNNFEINDNLYDELDIEKAYFNYSNKSKNPNYKGVPSGSFINFKMEDTFTIDDFNETYNNGLIGFYQVYIKKINNHNELFNKIGIIENKTFVFTSVQINSFKQFIDFKFINCSISPNCDIPFPESFKQKIDGKLSYYCKAYGLMMSESNHINTVVKPLKSDIQYYNLIDSEEINMYCNNDLIYINNKNDIIKTCKHIAYYIHSYTKTLIFQQLLHLNINEVFGVKIDSIVLKKEATINKILPCFYQEFKKSKIQKMIKNEDNSEGWQIDPLDGQLTYKSQYNNGYYRPLFIECEETIKFERSFLPNYEPIKSRTIFLLGKGGTGKSRTILSNLIDISMISLAWNLLQQKKEEYPNIKTLSINKLVGYMTEKENIKNKFIFIDEITMWNEKDINYGINNYKGKFIFIAGDIGKDGKFYQCNIQNKVINISKIKNCQCVYFTKNYRFDDELNQILDELRLIETKDEQTKFINRVFKNNFKSKEEINFDDNCIGISDINDIELTNYFLNKGAKPQYYIKETRFNIGQYKGARLDNIPDHNNYEIKLFKTIHSFQGLELNHDQKLIISNVKNFDFNLWYTAFSRARRLDQIIILKN